jgi:ATP-dependent Clp protease adaptor protein ClpS
MASKTKRDENVLLLEKEKVKLKRPDRYQVILLNDDFTPQEFVIWVLAEVFQKSMQESKQIMWTAHTTGSAVCGTYPLDIAKTKVAEVHRLADEEGHPLQCTLAKEE